MLVEKIKADRMAAMKARNIGAKTILTVLLGELENIAKRTGAEITDDIVIKVCKKFIAGNNEVIEAGAKVKCECPILTAENVILETFIPKQLTKDELYVIIDALKADNLGTVMKHLKANHDGTYDGKLAADVAHTVLSR